MRCKKACEYLGLESDGLLPPEAAHELEEHLDTCPECRSYRADLQTGRRLLAATATKPSENFEWRLQVRLNQTLQEAAGRAAYPWVEDGAVNGTWDWLRNFGAAAAVGMAAVLALAVFFGPTGFQPGSASGDRAIADGQVSPARTSPVAVASDRLPLTVNRFGGTRRYGDSAQRSVSTGGLLDSQTPFSLDRSWSGDSMENQRTIWRLQNENMALRWRAFQLQNKLNAMRTQLDTSAANTLDLRLEE